MGDYISEAMLAGLMGDREAMNKASDKATLKMLIQRHPTFFCPVSDAMLDVRRAVALEIETTDENGDQGFSYVGPYDEPGILARFPRLNPDLLRQGMIQTAADEGYPQARLLDGPALFGGE